MEDFIVEELLAVRKAESRFATDLQKMGPASGASLRAASRRLANLQTRMELLAVLLEEPPVPEAFTRQSWNGEQVLTCA